MKKKLKDSLSLISHVIITEIGIILTIHFIFTISKAAYGPCKSNLAIFVTMLSSLKIVKFGLTCLRKFLVSETLLREWVD